MATIYDDCKMVTFANSLRGVLQLADRWLENNPVVIIKVVISSDVHDSYLTIFYRERKEQ